jgi:YbbR domain-containing protein
VEFDARATRWIPVQPRVVGTFPAGYHLANARTDPDKVEIIGPKKEIDAVESAITDPIDVTGVLDTITVMRPAYVSDPLIQVTDPHPVRVTITIQKDEAAPKTKSE